MQGLMFDSQLLLHSLLWRTERLFAKKEIVTRLGPGAYHRYTYQDFGKRSRRLGDALKKLGLAPGERVGSLAWNTYRHLETHFAVPGIQSVPASGTFAIAEASTVSAHRSSGSSECTFVLPQARASI